VLTRDWTRVDWRCRETRRGRSNGLASPRRYRFNFRILFIYGDFYGSGGPRCVTLGCSGCPSSRLPLTIFSQQFILLHIQCVRIVLAYEATAVLCTPSCLQPGPSRVFPHLPLIFRGVRQCSEPTIASLLGRTQWDCSFGLAHDEELGTSIPKRSGTSAVPFVNGPGQIRKYGERSIVADIDQETAAILHEKGMAGCLSRVEVGRIVVVRLRERKRSFEERNGRL